VEAAAMVAIVRVGDPACDKNRGRVFTRCFAQVMEEFSAQLLKQSGNGSAHVQKRR
jgi:hypothetical protein